MRLESEDENIRDLNQTGVRIPKELKAKIKASAKQNRHSMNAEIVGRLEASFAVGEGFEGLSADQMELIKTMISHLKYSNQSAV